MTGKSINFEDKKSTKAIFTKTRNLFKLEDIDVNEILVSNKESQSTENSLNYFIGYNDG